MKNHPVCKPNSKSTPSEKLVSKHYCEDTLHYKPQKQGAGPELEQTHTHTQMCNKRMHQTQRPWYGFFHFVRRAYVSCAHLDYSVYAEP